MSKTAMGGDARISVHHRWKHWVMEQMILPKGKYCLEQANKVDSIETLLLSQVLF